jgi:hypothetical protein
MNTKIKLLLVIVALSMVGCGAADKQAAAYRDKARQRFGDKEYGKAVANYDKAIERDKKGKLPGIGDERRRAVHEYVKSQLAAAWDQFDHGNFEAAHDILLKLRAAETWGDAALEKVVEKSLADIASMRLNEADRMMKQLMFVPAAELADFVVKPLRPDHPLRVRAEGIRRLGVAYHVLFMRQTKNLPGATAFNYLVAKRLGVDRMDEGVDAVRAAKQFSGDSTKLADEARAYNTRLSNATTADVIKDMHWRTVNAFVLARATSTSSEWDSGALKYFKEQFGIADEKLLAALWDGGDTVVAYNMPDKDELPAPDSIADVWDEEIDTSSTSSSGTPSWRMLSLYYGVGTQILDADNLSTAMGARVLIPGKKVAHEPAFEVESSALGGGVGGYTAQWTIYKGIGSYGALGVGIGYGKSEQSDPDMGIAPLRSKSLFVPISLTYPVADILTLRAEWDANYYDLAGEEMTDYAYYSPFVGRVSLPLPLLPRVHKLFRNLDLEGYVRYADGAPNDLVYGGGVVYRKGMSGGSDDEDDDDDLWDKIEDSPFAVGSLVGPVIDVWFEIEQSLLDDSNANGMGTLIRIPTNRKKSIIEYSLWIQTSGFGGGIGGWGTQYMSMKGISKFGVLGYGLGYMANSQSEVAEGAIELKQRSFYIPIVLRLPVASMLIASVEFRANLLQLGGSGEPGEHQAFSPLIGRLWTPVPILPSLISFFRKVHIEGRVQYAFDAPNEFIYGGALVWRPIQDK